MWMRDAVRREKFPEIDKLDDPRYFPYRYGQALMAYIGARFGDEAVVPFGVLAAEMIGMAVPTAHGVQTGEWKAYEESAATSRGELLDAWDASTARTPGRTA